MLVALSEKNFGANGFMLRQLLINMRKQASLVGFQRLSKGNFTWKPKVYWRRNQDEYVFIRKNPSIYRNLHISNKIAAELNGSYTSNIGVTGFGIETAKVFLSVIILGIITVF
jgi:iron complex outermembrane receptor protein